MRARVLFIQQYFYPDISAVSQLLGDLTQELSKTRKYDVTVLCTSVARPTQKELPSRFGRITIKRIPVPYLEGSHTLVSMLQTAFFHIGVLFFLAISSRYDVVVTLTSPPLIGFTTALALLTRRSKLLYYIEDLYPEILFDSRVVRKTFLVKKLSIFNRITLRRSDRTVVIGAQMARKLHLNYRIPQSGIDIIPNWVNGVATQPPPDSSKLVIMYSGNLGFAHDLALLPDLISAMKDLDVHYRFIGSGRQFFSVQKLFQEAGETRVTFEGYVSRDQHSDTLAQANVFLAAQSWRTIGDLLPSKFYSYLAAGRPLIFLGPSRSEIGETISQHDLGVVVEIPQDILSARQKIVRFLTDRRYYEETCARAAAVNDKNYGLSRSAAAFEAVLDGLMARSG